MASGLRSVNLLLFCIALSVLCRPADAQQEVVDLFQPKYDTAKEASSTKLHAGLQLFVPLNLISMEKAYDLVVANETLARKLNAKNELATSILQHSYLEIWLHGNKDLETRIQNAEALFDESSSPKWLAGEYYRYSFLVALGRDDDSRIKNSLNKAFTFASQCEDETQRALQYFNIAFTRIAFGDSPLVDGPVQQMLKEMERVGRKKKIESLSVAVSICKCIWEGSSVEKQKAHASDAIKKSQRNPRIDSEIVDIAYDHLAHFATVDQDYKEALRLHLECKSREFATTSLPYINMTCAQIADCYMKLQQPEMAIEQLEQMDFELVEIFDPDLSDSACRTAVSAYRAVGNRDAELLFAGRLLNDEHLQRLDQFHLKSTETAELISELEYENTLKQSRIEEANSKLLAAKDRAKELQSRNQKIFIAAGAMLLLGITVCGLLIFRNRLQQAKLALANQKLSAEEQLRSSELQRYESLSLLASGIAHDFNNILASIVSNAEFLKFDLDLTKKTHSEESLEAIVQSAVRASELSNQMLTYAGKRKTERVVCDLNEIAKANVDLLSTGNAASHVLMECTSDSIPVSVDRTQINQVLLNLIGNAQKASDGGKEIRIRTSSTRLDSPYDKSFVASPLQSGEFATIEVQDFGSGIGANQIQQIFEPFYSDFHEGRGLGLAVVYGIVTAHEGAIQVLSKEGQGTTVRVHLPLEECHSFAIPQTPSLSLNPANFSIPRAKMSILIVDDEELVRKSVARILNTLNFATDTASNGKQALRQIEQRGEEAYDLILLDVVMPIMDAHQFLGKFQGDVPVIVMTGNSQSNLSKLSQDSRIKQILEKPFTSKSLNDVINSALFDSIPYSKAQ